MIKHPGFRKWVFEKSGYNKFGFYHDDLEVMGHFPEHPPTEPVYKEALRRLPAHEYDQYCYRVIRAAQMEITKSVVENPPTFEEVFIELFKNDSNLLILS